MDMNPPTHEFRPSHWEQEGDVDEAIGESFPASDPPAYSGGVDRWPSLSERWLDPEAEWSFREIEPWPLGENPRSALEAADEDVQDTIGGE